MAFNYPTVSIGALPYPAIYAVYGDVADATTYLQASLTTPATEWIAATPTLQAQSLVQATRWLDSAVWQGTPTDPITPQALQWPRIGISGVDPNSLPVGLVFACFELAAALVDDPDLRSDLSTPIAKELHAGSVGIQYFRPDSVFINTFFPTNIMGYVGLWLSSSATSTDGGAGPAGAPVTKGTHGKNEISDFGFLHGF